MKKLICVILCIICIFSLCSCSPAYISYSKKQTDYQNTITSLFAALDSNDEDAIYNLFSPAVRQKDQDLKEQICKLQSVYEGPVSEIGWDGLLASGASKHDGKIARNAYTSFPVRCGDTYYWCYLDLMYENTFKREIGIVQLNFYTADEYCILRYDDNAKILDCVGLEVFAEKTIDEDIRSIEGWPLKYSSKTAPLDLEDVKAFFVNSYNFEDFIAQFGEPNAENIFTYYELPPENNKPRYLRISKHNNIISSASIVDNFYYLELIFDEDQ